MLEEKGRESKTQVQADYDAAAPLQDILAQRAADDAVLALVQPLPAPVKYAFEERTRIPQAGNAVPGNPVNRGRMTPR